MLVGAATVALGLALLAPLTAHAQATGTTNYTATLSPVALNKSTGSGTLSLALTGNSAVITEHVTGLAATFSGAAYPHVQHIHIGGNGVCPDASADTSGDGLISTAEGGPSYGAIGATLGTSGDTSPAAGTTLTIAPSGANFDYSRTITLDAATLASVQAGKAVIVVHGLDPATLSAAVQAEKSELVPSLPLAATSPAICGTLTAAQAGAAAQAGTTPAGAPSTGGGSTAGTNPLLLAAGIVLLVGAAGAFGLRMRSSSR